MRKRPGCASVWCVAAPHSPSRGTARVTNGKPWNRIALPECGYNPVPGRRKGRSRPTAPTTWLRPREPSRITHHPGDKVPNPGLSLLRVWRLHQRRQIDATKAPAATGDVRREFIHKISTRFRSARVRRARDRSPQAIDISKYISAYRGFTMKAVPP